MKTIQPNFIGIRPGGISKADYQAALDAAAAKQRELYAKQSQLTAAQNNAQYWREQCEQTQAALQTKTDECDAAQTELTRTQTELTASEALVAKAEEGFVLDLTQTGNTAKGKHAAGLFKDNALRFPPSRIKLIGGDDDRTNLEGLFKNCTEMRDAPEMDTANVRVMVDMFNGCTGLVNVPEYDTSNCHAFTSMFSGCRSLVSLPRMDVSKVAEIYAAGQKDGYYPFPFLGIFRDCTSLVSLPPNIGEWHWCGIMMYVFQACYSLVEVPPLDTADVTSLYGTFTSCLALKYIRGLDVGGVTNFYGIGGPVSPLAFLKMTNFGKPSGALSFPHISTARHWGEDPEGETANRQSLVDTLLTYSFDRSTATYTDDDGNDQPYAPWAVTLHPDVLARLTDDEKAAITAKGFTLAS